MKEKKYIFIANDILSKIKSGEAKKGEKLPSEYLLAEQYNCSRITITAALKKLKAANFIYSVKKGGTFVNGFTKADKTKIFALVLPFESDFSQDIIDECQKLALHKNFFINFFNSENSVAKEKEILESILKIKYDGILIYPCSSFGNVDIASKIRISSIPMVFLDREIIGIDSPLVTSDNKRGMSEIVDYLICHGHKDIGFFSAYDSVLKTVQDRFKGYCNALINRGIEINSDFIFNFGDVHLKDKSLTLKKQNELNDILAKSYFEHFSELKKKPTAICCVNNYCALALLNYFKLTGDNPHNITLTGFDRVITDSFFGISFIAAKQDFKTMSSVALNILLKMAEGEFSEKLIKIPTKLIT